MKHLTFHLNVMYQTTEETSSNEKYVLKQFRF